MKQTLNRMEWVMTRGKRWVIILHGNLRNLRDKREWCCVIKIILVLSSGAWEMKQVMDGIFTRVIILSKAWTLHDLCNMKEQNSIGTRIFSVQCILIPIIFQSMILHIQHVR